MGEGVEEEENAALGRGGMKMKRDVMGMRAES